MSILTYLSHTETPKEREQHFFVNRMMQMMSIGLYLFLPAGIIIGTFIFLLANVMILALVPFLLLVLLA